MSVAAKYKKKWRLNKVTYRKIYRELIVKGWKPGLKPTIWNRRKN